MNSPENARLGALYSGACTAVGANCELIRGGKQMENPALLHSMAPSSSLWGSEGYCGGSGENKGIWSGR